MIFRPFAWLYQVFKYAGYDLDKMVDDYFADSIIEKNRTDRIGLYKSFINDNAVKIEIDYKKRAEFQPGDFIFLQEGIAVLSDKRNRQGLNFVIMIENGKVVEKEDIQDIKISGHYRFDSSLIDDGFLKR